MNHQETIERARFHLKRMCVSAGFQILIIGFLFVVVGVLEYLVPAVSFWFNWGILLALYPLLLRLGRNRIMELRGQQGIYENLWFQEPECQPYIDKTLRWSSRIRRVLPVVSIIFLASVIFGFGGLSLFAILVVIAFGLVSAIFFWDWVRVCLWEHLILGIIFLTVGLVSAYYILLSLPGLFLWHFFLVAAVSSLVVSLSFQLRWQKIVREKLPIVGWIW